MELLPVTDSMFLLGESREHPLHVGGLQLFELPDGEGPGYVIEQHRRMIADTDVAPLFRHRPVSLAGTPGSWAWTDDDQLDLEYHVRLSALPTPGRVRELLELTSRLHGTLLDRHRPLWEFHLIEGLQGNRFATYTKVHHALLDGVAALRLLQRTLSRDPDERDLRPPWVQRAGADTSGGSTGPFSPLKSLATAARAVGELIGLAPLAARALNDVVAEQALPFQAPKSMLNVPITGARRFAAQGWPLERIRTVGRAARVTVNDVMLAMCAGALRQYLQELNALPARPLLAAVPISLRSRARQTENGAGSEAGNALGLILCTLATDLEDPARRLAAIAQAMGRGKRIYSQLTPLQITALSAIPIASLLFTPIPGLLRITPPAYNVMISNVPGPSAPLYYNGARMQGVYPVSIPYDGQALNITVTSYAGNLEFGLTGCRRSVPHLQRMLAHLETSLAELEKVTA